MAERLRTLLDLAAAIGAETVAADARGLAERLAEGRFYVACLGQFKRGKSSLINALVGASLLPVGVLPVTAAVTVVRHGESTRARVQTAAGWQDVEAAGLADWVTEERNPGNRKGVLAVELFVPSPLLARGMCLVDTPGIGSTFTANTETTRAFVPQIDAALVVLGADPPITADELELVADAARQVDDLIFVLSKADRVPAADLDVAVRFIELTVAAHLGRGVAPVLTVSAAERLAGTGPGRDWDRLVAELEWLAGESGWVLVAAAEERGVAALAERLGAELDERRAALLRPVADTEARLAVLERAAADAERALADLGPLFTAEAARLGEALETLRERFRADRAPHDELAAAATPTREAAMRAARAIAERRVQAWQREIQPRAEALYRKTATRFVAIANGLLAELARAPGLERLPRTLPEEAGFRARSAFHFHDLLTVAAPGAGRALLDRLVPAGRRQPAIARDAAAYLDRLLETNSARVVNDLRERVLESRRGLEREIRGRLAELVASTRRALEAGRAAAGAGRDATAGTLAQIDDWLHAIHHLGGPR